MEPWIATLTTGSAEAAWDVLIDRYRRLIFSAIRRYTTDADDVMDVFARICEALRENDFQRLRRYAEQADTQRKFSTWLCAVVHNLTVDWIRHRDGRPRLTAAAAALPELQQRIFALVFVDQRSHVESYELLKSRHYTGLSFTDFLKELSATYRAAGSGKRGRLILELAPELPDLPADTSELDPAVLSERQSVLDSALQSLSDEDRVAVQLYVIDGVPADQVARSLGLQNAKAVYNRVYRALAQLRERLERSGIGAGNL